jgi:hypothetical protein
MKKLCRSDRCYGIGFSQKSGWSKCSLADFQVTEGEAVLIQIGIHQYLSVHCENEFESPRNPFIVTFYSDIYQRK